MAKESVAELADAIAQRVVRRDPGALNDIGGTCATDFDELVARVGAPEAVGALAERCWGYDALLLEAVAGAQSLEVCAREPKRIATFYHTLGTGGGERVTMDSARMWRRMGYEVLLLCDEGCSAGVDLSEDDICIVELPDSLNEDGALHGARAQALYEALTSARIDTLVYSQWLCPAVGWDFLVTRLAGARFYVFTHGTTRVLAGYRNTGFPRLPALYRHFDGVACLSSEDEKLWSSVNDNVICVVNRVDEAFLKADVGPAKEHVMLWVGRIAGDKDPLEAIDVLAKVRQEVPDARLVMAGPFGNIPYEMVRARAEGLGVWDALELPGDVAHDDLPAYLGKGRLLLFTSHLEGYPVALAEGKAAGLPCVSYNLSNVTMLEGGRGTLVAPVGDVAGLARRAVRVLIEPGLAERMGADAHAHAEELQRTDLEGLWRSLWDDAEPMTVPRASLTLASLFLNDSVFAEDERARGDMCQARVHELERELEACRARADELERDRDQVLESLRCVEGSVSFKVGRALTAPLRTLRDHAKRS